MEGPDRRHARQAEMDQAVEMARGEAMGLVGEFAALLLSEIGEARTANISASYARQMIGALPPTNTLADHELRMTGPDWPAHVRLLAMDRLWARHMAALEPWIQKEAEKSL